MSVRVLSAALDDKSNYALSIRLKTHDNLAGMVVPLADFGPFSSRGALNAIVIDLNNRQQNADSRD